MVLQEILHALQLLGQQGQLPSMVLLPGLGFRV